MALFPALPVVLEWLGVLSERQYREHRDAFEMPDDLFRQHFRLTKHLVKWLCEELRGDLEKHRVYTGAALTVEQQVLCGLRFYATGSFQGVIASDEHLAVSQTSLSRCIHAVTDAIVNCLGHEWISFPCTPSELATVREDFELLDSRFPGCVGAIDGTMVCITAPSDEINRPTYFCRKGYYALNVMVVCDANLRIRALDATFPGSVHDSCVWRASPVHHALCHDNFLRSGEYLLGDGSYPLQPWLITPIPGCHAHGSAAARFNSAHSSLRSVVERTIGVLQSRFRCLQRYRALHYEPEFAAKIVAACAVLHNVCIYSRLPELDSCDGDDLDGDTDLCDDEEASPALYQAGRHKRDELLQTFVRQPRT